MDEIQVRIAGPDDLDSVFSLVEELVGELGEEGDDLGTLDKTRVAKELREIPERTFTFLAETKSKDIVAVMTVVESFAIYANGFYGIINEMFVRSSFRSTGVGADLIRQAVLLGSEKNWSRIEVTAPESQRWIRTRQFYERQGFSFAGPKLKYQI